MNGYQLDTANMSSCVFDVSETCVASVLLAERLPLLLP